MPDVAEWKEEGTFSLETELEKKNFFFFFRKGRFERKDGNREVGRKGAGLKGKSITRESQNFKELRVHSRFNPERSRC